MAENFSMNIRKQSFDSFELFSNKIFLCIERIPKQSLKISQINPKEMLLRNHDIYFLNFGQNNKSFWKFGSSVMFFEILHTQFNFWCCSIYQTFTQHHVKQDYKIDWLAREIGSLIIPRFSKNVCLKNLREHGLKLINRKISLQIFWSDYIFYILFYALHFYSNLKVWFIS